MVGECTTETRDSVSIPAAGHNVSIISKNLFAVGCCGNMVLVISHTTGSVGSGLCIWGMGKLWGSIRWPSP